MESSVGDDMNDNETPLQRRLRQIAESRAALAARYEADPDAVQRFEARKANLDAVRRRERQRVDTLVLGNKLPPEPMPKKPAGMSKQEWRIERGRIQRERDAAKREADRFLGRAGTPETLAQVEGTHTGSLEQLERNGTLTKDQREWAAQISNVHRSIESDTTVKIASFEARVDQSVRSPAIAERIHRVRMHRAYTFWRGMLPAPKAIVLDMIVGDAIGYTVAARRHRVHNRKALRLLVEAINRWPLSVAQAFSVIDQDMVDAMNRAVRPYYPAALDRPAPVAVESYRIQQMVEPDREHTDEPYLLPKLDPEFLDERGFLRPWAELAAIVRERVFSVADAA